MEYESYSRSYDRDYHDRRSSRSEMPSRRHSSSHHSSSHSHHSSSRSRYHERDESHVHHSHRHSGRHHHRERRHHHHSKRHRSDESHTPREEREHQEHEEAELNWPMDTEAEEKLRQERRNARLASMEQIRNSPTTAVHTTPTTITTTTTTAEAAAPSPADPLSSSSDISPKASPPPLLESSPPAPTASVESTQDQVLPSQSEPFVQPQHSPQQGTFSKDSEFDMFSGSPVDKLQEAKLSRTLSQTVDAWDDADGYYLYHIGDLLNDRYKIFATQGKGVFSTVVKAQDTLTNENVSIKIIRNNETMYKAGQKELKFLREIVTADPNNHSHCVRIIDHFTYRHHLCLVFETLHANLREVLKRFGKDIGINISAVKMYAQQLVRALRHLKNLSIIHGDFKPDNILVSERKNVVKLCDFGSASYVSEMEITPYLVSRWYRAPEIILGLPYGPACDMWSLGTVLFELYTGNVLFTGRSNNDMLRLFQEVRGPFPVRMLRKAQFVNTHFDNNFNFRLHELDPITNKPVIKTIPFVKPTRTLHSQLFGQSMDADEARIAIQLESFLDRCLTLDPEKRMTPQEALQHDFLTSAL